jgi:hypothetical protein
MTVVIKKKSGRNWKLHKSTITKFCTESFIIPSRETVVDAEIRVHGLAKFSLPLIFLLHHPHNNLFHIFFVSLDQSANSLHESKY